MSQLHLDAKVLEHRDISTALTDCVGEVRRVGRQLFKTHKSNISRISTSLFPHVSHEDEPHIKW